MGEVGVGTFIAIEPKLLLGAWSRGRCIDKWRRRRGEHFSWEGSGGANEAGCWGERFVGSSQHVSVDCSDMS